MTVVCRNQTTEIVLAHEDDRKADWRHRLHIEKDLTMIVALRSLQRNSSGGHRLRHSHPQARAPLTLGCIEFPRSNRFALLNLHPPLPRFRPLLRFWVVIHLASSPPWLFGSLGNGGRRNASQVMN
jgi:hypothetical protein